MDAVAIRVDADGNELWQKYFGNNPFYDYALAAAPTADGGFLVAGTSKRMHTDHQPGQDNHDNQIALVKFSADGDIISELYFKIKEVMEG